MPDSDNHSSPASSSETSFARVLVRYRRALVIALHVSLIAVSNYGAFWLRFEGAIPIAEFHLFVRMLPWLVVIRTTLFVPLRLYEGLWRYAGLWDLRNILIGVGSSTLVFYILVQSIFGLSVYPRSIVFIDSLLLICLMSGARLGRRMYRELCRIDQGKRVLVFGAGDAGEMLVRDIKANPRPQYRVVGFIDDDPAKVGQRIHGVPVLGSRNELSHIMAQQKPDEVLLAIPGSDPTALRGIVRRLDRYNVPIKTVPSLSDILDNRVKISRIRDLSLEDLLSRGPIGLNPAPLRDFLKGRRVLVSGAGGSIGAELCRQIASFGVDALILFERHENSLYHIANDLTDLGHRTGVHPVLGDVADAARVTVVLTEYRPEIIFHAAAHKHVPLMEQNACEAVKNNVSGTRVLMEAAERCGVDRFILISTDKAVNPTSVMGATKRIAELMLLTQGVGSGTSFMTVRFGNVLASAGSVVPRFLQQIRSGGPVTVTHPEMRRYFMLISEAVQLVLHAAANGEGGKLYVLEMGEQVKLSDMARDLIRLSGFIPEVDIPITFVGLRPGEKLYEELIGPDESAKPSCADNVMMVTPRVSPNPEVLAMQRARLEEAASRNDTSGVLEHLGRLIPAFTVGRSEVLAALSPMKIASISTVRNNPKATSVQQLCPDCGSRVQRSHARSRIEEWRKSVSQKRPYRCQVCRWRGWLVPWQIDGGDAVPVEDLLAPDFNAIDKFVHTSIHQERPVFAPRNLLTPPASDSNRL